MRVKVLYFASLRDDAGVSQEYLETGAKTIRELFEEINGGKKFKLSLNNLRAARNEEYTDFDALLREGDVIAFIPPVAGG